MADLTYNSEVASHEVADAEYDAWFVAEYGVPASPVMVYYRHMFDCDCMQCRAMDVYVASLEGAFYEDAQF